MISRDSIFLRLILVVLSFPFLAASVRGDETPTPEEPARKVYVVPNFHPASCGWLTDWSTERSFCANSYLDHLDRVRDDGNYSFAISEVNNMIAILNFQPERFEELKRRIREGRVEAVNAFFLEPAIGLSGGEALVRQGVEGLRWQKAVLGVEPRMSWMIDVTSTHEQMAQIVSELGLEALVQCRPTVARSTLTWLESPDGTRTLGMVPGLYSSFNRFFRAKETLKEKQFDELVKYARERKHYSNMPMIGRTTLDTPEGLPFLILGGSGDYSLSPLYRNYPSEFLTQWKTRAPDLKLRFTTMKPYLDEVSALLKEGKVDLPVEKGGWPFCWNSFWIQNPTVKGRFRRSEHDLQAAEMLASIAGLCGTDEHRYPSRDLNHAWLLMMLNMDRNTLWGAAGGMVFEHDKSWDARDRFDRTDAIGRETAGKALRALSGGGEGAVVFNPLNWNRTDPLVMKLPDGQGWKGVVCQSLGEGAVLCRPDLPPVGTASLETEALPAGGGKIELPETLETEHYQVRIDPETGDLVGLKLKKSGRELLGGPANVLVAEKAEGFGDQMQFRADRKRVDSSTDHAAEITVTEGPLAVIVEVRSEFFGGKTARRVMRFHRDHPRIDFDTWLEDIPDRTVVLSEFPLAEEVTEVRRGIPYGFSLGGWNGKNDHLHGKVDGITSAVRWSHYTLQGGGGFALLDRGLTGREITGNTPVLFLMAAADKYHNHPCSWLSGGGKHHFQYAVVAHDEPWREAGIPRMAWEFNSRPVVAQKAAGGKPRSFIDTSANLILQSIRREGTEVELRMMECLGVAGKARIDIRLPHTKAELTDMVGTRRAALTGDGTYRFDVRPQQIVTIRIAVKDGVAPVEPLTDWTPLVPEHKIEALNRYHPEFKGHTGRKH